MKRNMLALAAMVVVALLLWRLGHPAATAVVSGQPQVIVDSSAKSNALNVSQGKGMVSGKPGEGPTPDPQGNLDRFREIAEKVVLTSQERRELNAMLASPDVLDEASRNLLIDPRHDSMPPSKRRLRSVGLMEAALAWRENPAREEVRRLVRSILLFPNLSAESSQTIQRSIAGDKVDLYTTLLRVDRAEADRVYREARATGANLKLITAVRRLQGASD